MNEDLYKELMVEWAKCGRVYAEAWIFPRLEIFKGYLDYYKGKDVLEIGCNAGVFAYEIAKHAKSYIGVEKDKDYYEQAMITAKHINHDHCGFINGDVFSVPVDLNYNAFIGLFVLYHFSNMEVAEWKNAILPKCDTVIIQIRLEERKEKKNVYGFYKPENVICFLSHAGFKIVENAIQPKKEQFSTIIAVR